MREPSILGVGGVEPVHVTSVVRPLPGERSSSERPIPGVDEFDRAELSSGGMPRAYAQFTVHQKTGQVSIKIIDADNDRVIREIPPEAVLKLAEQLQAYIEARRQRGG